MMHCETNGNYCMNISVSCRPCCGLRNSEGPGNTPTFLQHAASNISCLFTVRYLFGMFCMHRWGTSNTLCLVPSVLLSFAQPR